MNQSRKTDESKMMFSGKAVGITKVRNDDGMAFRITIDKSVYLEINSITNPEMFKSLCKIADLGDEVKITIEKG